MKRVKLGDLCEFKKDPINCEFPSFTYLEILEFKILILPYLLNTTKLLLPSVYNNIAGCLPINYAVTGR